MPGPADVISVTVAESAELTLYNNTAARKQLIELIWESLLWVRQTAASYANTLTFSKVNVRAGMLLNNHLSLPLFA